MMPPIAMQAHQILSTGTQRQILLAAAAIHYSSTGTCVHRLVNRIALVTQKQVFKLVRTVAPHIQDLLAEGLGSKPITMATLALCSAITVIAVMNTASFGTPR